MPATELKRCLNCGYILEYLPEPRCPECGRGFDPDDARTYHLPNSRGGRVLVFVSMASALATIPAIAFLVVEEWLRVPRAIPGLLGFVALAGAVCSLIAIGRALDLRHRGFSSSDERKRTRLAIFISVTVVAVILLSLPLSRGSGGALYYGCIELRRGSGSSR
jgi:hypothetical protein